MMFHRFLNWLNGWRLDLDGFWVRAKRIDDPQLSLHPALGFTDEGCIGARTPEIAYAVDNGMIQTVETARGPVLLVDPYWTLKLRDWENSNE